jgi:TolB-like protein/DNA-binding winged helix-turn-helix (wHTH) protein/Flp pilus assembly protein TadD
MPGPDKERETSNVTPIDSRRGRPTHGHDDKSCVGPPNPYVGGGKRRKTKAMPADAESSINFDDGFRVGEFEVYPKRLTVHRNGTTTRLEPKVMAVLVYLAERADEVVTRNEFADHVWRGRIVSDEVLSRDISILRSQLGDDAKEPRYVLTIPRVGYRLVAKVEELRADIATEASATTATTTTGETAATALTADLPKAPRRRIAMGFAVVAVALAAVIAYLLRNETPALDRTHIAVLPFASLSDSSGDHSFSDGLTEEIMHALGAVDGISVVAKTSSFAFRKPTRDVREIGQELDAGSLLEGSVRRDGDRLRIIVQLIDANTGLQVWSENYDRRMSDIFAIQNRISTRVAQKLIGTLAPDTLPAAPTQDIEAYTLFLRANFLLRQRGAAQLTRAIELYQQAITRDPNFARAYTGLAEAYTVQPSYTGMSELAGQRLAQAAAERAEALGEDPARLAGLRGYLHFRSRQWTDAQADFKVALAANADDPDALQWYSTFLASAGWMARARDAAQRSVKVDPLSPAANQRAGVVSLWANDLAAARGYFSIATELGIERNGLPEALLALLLREGRFDDARRVLYETQQTRHQSTAWIEPVLAAITGTGSAPAAVEAVNRDYQAGTLSVPMYFDALIVIGDVDGFYAAIDGVVATGEPFDIEVLFSGTASGIRTDPRFAALATALGLVDFWDAEGWPDMCARTSEQISCT